MNEYKSSLSTEIMNERKESNYTKRCDGVAIEMAETEGFISPIMKSLVSSDDTITLIKILDNQINDHQFEMPLESVNAQFIQFILSLLRTNMDNKDITSHIMTIITNIYQIAQKTSKIIYNFYNESTNNLIKVLIELIRNIQFEQSALNSKTINLCSIIANKNHDFLEYLLANGIVTLLKELISCSNEEFDISSIACFIKMIISNSSFNNDFYELLTILFGFIISSDYYNRYIAIKLLNFALKSKIIQEDNIESVKNLIIEAYFIDEVADKYTIDKICNFFILMIEFGFSFDSFLLKSECIISLIYKMKIIKYIPGKFKWIDKLLIYYLKQIPDILIENDFLSFLEIDNGNIQCKSMQILCIFMLFENAEISNIVSFNFPCVLFTLMCEAMSIENDSLKIIVKIIIKIIQSNEDNYVYMQILDSYLDETLLENMLEANEELFDSLIQIVDNYSIKDSN